MIIHLKPDAERNLLTIRYAGHIVAAYTAANLATVRAAIQGLRPGFGLMIDFTDLISMEPACAPHIGAIMDYANAQRVAAVVRVIPDPRLDIGMEIMSRFHYGSEVVTFTCTNVEEAMRVLFD